MRVVRIYHGGRDPAHRAREDALRDLGVELRLVVPKAWPGPNDLDTDLDVVELPVIREGDVNRFHFADTAALEDAIHTWSPDVLDIHEEPVSLAARQVLGLARGLPVVMYSAQNLDKRWPPPFGKFERQALSSVNGMYPCSRQAASVLCGKGYQGLIRPLPLGIDPAVHYPGDQRPEDEPLVLGLVGRLVPEKGIRDALLITKALSQEREVRLLIVGAGPAAADAHSLAHQLGVQSFVEWVDWVDGRQLGALYRRMHIVLVPSVSTATWVEQFGRVITEGGANGAVALGYASGSIPEVIAGCGLVVPEGDLVALTQAARSLASRGAEWRECRAHGLARAEEITWSQIAVEQAALYESARLAPAVPRSRPDRLRANQSWGPPARTALSSRPFALPVLRTSQTVHRVADRLTGFSAR